MIILMIIAVAFVVSLVVTVFVKLIYESKDGRKFSKSQFWTTVLISMLICGLISGAVCGGM
jgi:ABC-type Fe3+ transport system permease subunit